jgi:hypothetical protein
VNDGIFRAEDSIFSGNGSNDFSGVLISEGYNLIQNTNGCTITGKNRTGDIYGADPLLGPLQDNGGPTWTHALLPGSPAIDAGSSGGLNTDQRGAPRPYDVPGIPNAADGSDIGAFEYQGDVPTVLAVEDLMAQVESRWPHSRPLIASLSAALHSIQRGDFASAINQLQAFENKVRAQVAPSEPWLAARFIAAAQGLIDALRGGVLNPGGPPHGRFTAVARHPNGRVQMQWSAVQGRHYILEASTNLVDWERISEAVEDSDGMFTLEDAGNARITSSELTRPTASSARPRSPPRNSTPLTRSRPNAIPGTRACPWPS